MTCAHENRLRIPHGSICKDCGVVLQLTDPAISGIVDTCPRDYRMQLRVAAVIASAR